MPSTLPGSWRDSAISQLDAIAAANDRRAAARLRTQASVLAVLGLLALAIAAWLWGVRNDTVRGAAPTPVAAPEVPQGETAALAAPPAAVPSPAVPPPPAVAAPAVATPAPVAVVPPPPAPKPAAAPVPTRRARAEPTPVAARPTADVPARAVEPTPPPAEVPAPAPPLAAAPVVAPPPPMPRAGVRELCAASGFLAQGFCHARECAKAEHRDDAVCVRLREFAQPRSDGGGS